MYILKICTVVILVYYVTMLEAMMMMSVDKISGEAEIARDISHTKCFLLLFDSFYILHPNLHHLISLEIAALNPLQDTVVHHCIK